MPNPPPARRGACSSAHRRWCSPQHAALVEDYRAARHDYLLRAEALTVGGAAELADLLERGVLRPVLFRDWLLGLAHRDTAVA